MPPRRRASSSLVSYYRVIQLRTQAPFDEGWLLRGRGYRPHSIESSGSTPPLKGIPRDLLASALDTPSGISRLSLRAMPRFDLPLGVPDLGTREQLSNPCRWASVRSLEVLSVVRAVLTLWWKETSWQFVFLPVGHTFSGESRCDVHLPG